MRIRLCFISRPSVFKTNVTDDSGVFPAPPGFLLGLREVANPWRDIASAPHRMPSRNDGRLRDSQASVKVRHLMRHLFCTRLGSTGYVTLSNSLHVFAWFLRTGYKVLTLEMRCPVPGLWVRVPCPPLDLRQFASLQNSPAPPNAPPNVRTFRSLAIHSCVSQSSSASFSDSCVL